MPTRGADWYDGGFWTGMTVDSGRDYIFMTGEQITILFLPHGNICTNRSCFVMNLPEG